MEKGRILAVILLILILLSACGRGNLNFRGPSINGNISPDSGWRQAMGLTEERRIPISRTIQLSGGKRSETEVSPREIAIYQDSSESFPSPSQRSGSARAALRALSPLIEGSSSLGPIVKRSLLTLTGPLPESSVSTMNVLYDPMRYSPVSMSSDLVGKDGYQLFYLFRLREPEGDQGIIPVAFIRRNGEVSTQPQSESKSVKIIEITFEHRPAQDLRLISKTPTTDPGNAITLNATASTLTWNEARWGDWNNDGAVSALDVSPLALKFGKETNQTSANYWVYARYIDANGDGRVGAADLSPVAFHFGESTGGYNIYQADDSSGANSTFIKSVARPTPAADPNNPPFGVSLATTDYTYTGTAPDPPIIVNKYYRVIPFDKSNPAEESTGVASTWIRVMPTTQGPIANLSALPTSGPSPLIVDFDGTGSNDPDGQIVQYDFDFNGDGNVEVTNATGIAQNTYPTDGTYTATLRVTDNDGLIDNDAVVINVNTPPVNNPPTALAAANPTSGTAPLDVSFDGTGSSDPDPGDLIALYEWDFTNDSTYDVINNTGLANFTYMTAGDFTARLRVTDLGGLTGENTVTITVTPPVGQPPVAVAGAMPTNGNAPLNVIFTAIGSNDPDGSIVLYEWDYEGDIVYDWSDPMSGDTAFAYNTEGTYTATLRVTDNDGLTATDTVPITVTAALVNWARTWGGSSTDVAGGAIVDANGNIFVAGDTSSFGAGGTDALLLKYGTDGTLLWAKTWGGPTVDQFGPVAVDSNGDVLVAGNTDLGAGGTDALLVKYSNAGTLMWAKSWGGSNLEICRSIVLDTAGNIYISGDTMSFGAGGQDVMLLKYNSSGNLLWAKTWGGSGTEYGWNLTLDGSGNPVVAATTASFGTGLEDSALLNYDTNGTLLWAKTWGGTGADWGQVALVDGAGNIFLTGDEDSSGAGNYDNFLLKYDSGGNLLWAKSWGGTGLEDAWGLTFDGSGNVLITGHTDGFGAGDYDVLLESYDTDGNLLFAKTWGGAGRDWVNFSASDGSGNLFVAGEAVNNAGTWQSATGTEGSPTLTETSPTGTETSPTGTEGSPVGIEGTPTGTEDTGGGGTDTLLLKNY